jgi:hypothetical protein
MNNKNLVDLADPRDGEPQDAATKNYVDNYKTFTGGLTINGAGPINGFINFSSPVGVNGIGWATADMSWIGRIEEIDKHMRRLAVNDKPDGTGTDVATVFENGILDLAAGAVSHNLRLDPSGVWRTPNIGTGSLTKFINGTFELFSNDTATTIAFQPPTLRKFAVLHNYDGNFSALFDKSASGKFVRFQGLMAGKARWLLDLGNEAPESGTRTGSDFALHSFENDGVTGRLDVHIARETGLMSVGAGGITTSGSVTSSQVFKSSGANVMLAAGAAPGAVYLRPNTSGSASGGVAIDTTGNLLLNEGVAPAAGGVFAGAGIQTKHGYAGAYAGNWYNLLYQGGFVYVYIDSTLMGAITWQSDYRMKRNLKPLPSLWDKVKSLTPVSYSHRKFDIVDEDSTERWGLVAHELQEKLIPSVAFGKKDEKNVIQSINPLTMIAVLVKGLQEAMERIEALEARAP